MASEVDEQGAGEEGLEDVAENIEILPFSAYAGQNKKDRQGENIGQFIPSRSFCRFCVVSHLWRNFVEKRNKINLFVGFSVLKLQ